jgi:hypothetical protein
LANHINTSLTKIKHCRFGREKQSDAYSSEDDEHVSDWNFLVVISVITTNTTVKILHATGDEMDLFAGGPGHRGVT